MKEFNLNDCIYVKLNEKGWETIRKLDEEEKRYYSELRKPYTDKSRNENFFISKTVDGYTEFIMWEFMEIFGKHINSGLDAQYDMKVIISNESLINKPKIKSLSNHFKIR